MEPTLEIQRPAMTVTPLHPATEPDLLPEGVVARGWLRPFPGEAAGVGSLWKSNSAPGESFVELRATHASDPHARWFEYSGPLYVQMLGHLWQTAGCGKIPVRVVAVEQLEGAA